MKSRIVWWGLKTALVSAISLARERAYKHESRADPRKNTPCGDSAVIAKQTSQWDDCLPSLLLQVIRCDTLPLPRSPAAERLTQPTNQSPFHYCRWPSTGHLLPLRHSEVFLEIVFAIKHTERPALNCTAVEHIT